MSSGASSAEPRTRALLKSLAALVSQERSSSLRVSAIHLASLVQHFVGQASQHFADTVDLLSRPHEHVGGNEQPSQATLGALVSANGALVAVGHDDHEVNVAVAIGRAPGVRTKQPDLFRLKFRDQPLGGRLNEIFGERFSFCFF